MKEKPVIMKKCQEAMKILLVEDNPADIRLTQEVFREGRIPSELFIAKDGEEAIDFLRRRGKHAGASRPDLVLLDLNLPKKNGKEVLKEIKSDRNLAPIPVIVLTTSKAQEDICRTYDLHANCFITKPFDLDRFIAVARAIEQFWFKIVRLPRAAGGQT